MGILPARPLQVKGSFLIASYLGAAVMFLAGAALTVGVLWWQGGEARALKDELAVWQSGRPATRSNVSGKAKSHGFLFHDYDLAVDYTDENGTPRHGHREFTTLFVSIDQNAEPEVRHDPGAPERFALAWAVHVRGARFGAIAVMTLFLGLMGFFLVYGGFLTRRRADDVRQCAARSDEVLADELEVTEIRHNGRPTGAHQHKYRMPSGREHRVGFRKGYRPLYADLARKKLVTLVSPMAPDRPLVPRHDLHPFRLGHEAVEAVRERISKAGPTSG